MVPGRTRAPRLTRGTPMQTAQVAPLLLPGGMAAPEVPQLSAAARKLVLAHALLQSISAAEMQGR